MGATGGGSRVSTTAGQPRLPVLRVVDLYAGAGGMSLGFEQAGAATVLAVEADKRASETFASNHTSAKVLQENIGDEWDIVEKLNEHLDDSTVDILIGGPPCQGWSTLGPRGSAERRQSLNACVEQFLDQALRLSPPAIVMENVRGLAVKSGGQHLAHVVARLRRGGYRVKTHDVRAADYGVPQLRHRVFVVATKTALNIEYELTPTHNEAAWLTVWDAIGDLPALDSGGSVAAYNKQPSTPLQRRLRGGCRKLTWHEVPAHSDDILRVLRELEGPGASRATTEFSVRLTSGFHNTYARLWDDRPAPAVTSSAGRISSGRNAHPFDDRALSPREAARLQTFPDSFQWVGERWPVYQQIGNAVPPILAQAVASPLLSALQPVLH